MGSRATNFRNRTQPAPDFRKGMCCPSSDELLQYCQNSSRLKHEQRAALERHLAACDFCCAEFQLLTAHPPQKTKTGDTPVQMPVHLYVLARALLTKPPSTHFAEIMHASTALTLTDA